MDLKARIRIIQGDITVLNVDGIVNAANSALMPGGGVDGAIRRKAGHELNDDLCRVGRCPPWSGGDNAGIPAARAIRRSYGGADMALAHQRRRRRTTGGACVLL